MISASFCSLLIRYMSCQNSGRGFSWIASSIYAFVHYIGRLCFGQPWYMETIGSQSRSTRIVGSSWTLLCNAVVSIHHDCPTEHAGLFLASIPTTVGGQCPSGKVAFYPNIRHYSSKWLDFSVLRNSRSKSWWILVSILQNVPPSTLIELSMFYM